MHVISVVPEPERVVAEMARVCRPGGEVLILGHFLHEKGALGFLGRRMAPLADQLGWHPDFPKAPVLGCDRLELVEGRRARLSACSPGCGCAAGRTSCRAFRP